MTDRSLLQSRREFLSRLAASGATLLRGAPAGGRAPRPAPDPYASFAAEAARLTQACLSRFWDGAAGMFRAPVLSAEAVPSDARHDRGYTFWPSLIALHALIEGEKHAPGHYTAQIAAVCDGLEQYYSPDLHAYTAWIHFPGNRDAYYDDNAWAVIVLVEAHAACLRTYPARATRYLARAKTIMADYIVKGYMADYIVKGYDAGGKPGGMRWGSDPARPNTADRGTSSTAGSALAALLLARAGVDPAFHTRWGHDLLTWLSAHLLDADGLVMDALAAPDWTVRRIKWTYNTGVPLRAYVEHYRLTHSADSLAMAARLARAAIDRHGALFDQAVHDPAKRYYWDETYFVHYLFDGLLQVAQVTSDKGPAAAVVEAVLRSAHYARTYLRDSDGLYWRNWRLYTIGEAQRDVWQRWTGQTIAPAYDASERSQEPRYQTLPVSDRPLVKTLLANAGAARLFWLAARLPSDNTDATL